MQVNLEEINTAIQLGNNGVTFRVWDNAGNLKGRFRVGQASIECVDTGGNMGHGHFAEWDALIALMKTQPKG